MAAAAVLQECHMKAVHELRKVFFESFGPYGTITQIQNDCYGPVTASRQSKRILNALCCQNPIAKLIIETVNHHNLSYGDGGSFVGLLICQLISNYQRLNQLSTIHPRLFINILPWCCDIAVKLVSIDATLQRGFRIHTEDLILVAESIVSSKMLSYATADEVCHIAKLVAEAFIIAEGDIQCVAFSCDCGSLRDSRTYQGVTLDEHHSVTLPAAGMYCTAFVTCSLAGDIDHLETITCEGPSQDQLDKGIVSRIMALVSNMAEHKVTLMVCQKVIHPNVKAVLRKRNIVYLERLGSANMGRLLQYTGVCPVEHLAGNMSSLPLQLAQLDCCHVQSAREEKLLLLSTQNPKSYVCSVILCHWGEQLFLDIQSVCHQALKSLQLLTHNGHLITGAGEWQRAAAQAVSLSASGVSNETLYRWGATPYSFRAVTSAFSDALLSISARLANSSPYGERKRRDGESLPQTLPLCWDVREIQLSALKTATAITSAIVGIGNIITAD